MIDGLSQLARWLATPYNPDLTIDRWGRYAADGVSMDLRAWVVLVKIVLYQHQEATARYV